MAYWVENVAFCMYCPLFRQSPWLDRLAARGKLLILSIVDELPAFLAGSRGTLEMHGLVKTLVFQMVTFLLCFHDWLSQHPRTPPGQKSLILCSVSHSVQGIMLTSLAVLLTGGEALTFPIYSSIHMVTQYFSSSNPFCHCHHMLL